MARVHLSVPHIGAREEHYVREAFESNWVSTVGPNLDAFERGLEARLGRPAVALASGTAAIHLGLRLLGVRAGDEVLASDLTFVASVNPIRYLGATPVLVDSEPRTWNLCPARLEEALRARRRRPPRALVLVHLYGQCADVDPIAELCARHGVPILEDAAEAFGASYRGRPAGALGDVSVLSFNGNKLVTTSGGGALLGPREWVEKARFWSTQAREPGPAYQHVELGHNYRLSNVLAGIGRGQLEVLDDRVRQRRAVFDRYADAFADLPGVVPMPEAGHGVHTRWLSTFLVHPEAAGTTRDRILAALEAEDVEARPVWKPMHLQPLHAGCPRYGGAVSEWLFARGLCLPSSSSLRPADQDRVVEIVRRAVPARRPRFAGPAEGVSAAR